MAGKDRYTQLQMGDNGQEEKERKTNGETTDGEREKWSKTDRAWPRQPTQRQKDRQTY